MPREHFGWYYTETNGVFPKTTTQEMLENVHNTATPAKRGAHKQLVSFSTSLPHHDHLASSNFSVTIPLTTSYNRDYAPPFDNYICVPLVNVETEPDPLFNRKPCNEFEMRQSCEYKFMDDHFINHSESRKKINFMRQIRNTHHKIA
ncbi:uncharacterized protein LOC106084936 [Stomoxys calcitrans]|uniref:uncharacterized protein LOC106084936 n=1 Tax=Stomoxys calcitrans TaxID=35570 RepID=UPI0027E262E0|nr:uncharacterized protein LOC106084936 [Stomoxys calcitrans]